MNFVRVLIMSIITIISVGLVSLMLSISLSFGVEKEIGLVTENIIVDESNYFEDLTIDSEYGKIENFKILKVLNCRDTGYISGKLKSKYKIKSLRWGFFDSEGSKILIEEKLNLDTYEINLEDYLSLFRFSRLGVGNYSFRIYITTENERFGLDPILIDIKPSIKINYTDNAILDMKYINVSQGMNIGSHKGSYAIDLVGIDRGIDAFYAPFDGTIKKIYSGDYQGNFVWLESKEKYLFPDGSYDYISIMTGHDDNISDLYVGKDIKKGENYYQEGNSGKSTGNHIHLEVAKGKTTKGGWHINKEGKYQIDNPVRPDKLLYIKNSSTIIDDKGIKFQYQ
ncbi:MAG: M23 family metallopeptidase [Firmicutes bacterium]|nr:M23 family metallopeptidase [Bacillota bacterium]